MQRHLSSGMLDSSCSNLCSPEQKLRKISFHYTDFDQILKGIPIVESETVEGWGYETWNLKNSDFKLGKTLNKSCWVAPEVKNSESPKKYPVTRNKTLERTKYIEKLQEKLFELVSIKKERQYSQYINESPNSNCLTPVKPVQNVQKTTSTSESEGEKYEHNFTSTSLRKQFQKSPLFKHKRVSKELTSNTPVIKSGQATNDLKLNLKTHFNRSMLTSYEQMSQRSKEISVISYPVIDQQRKPRHRRLTKLQDFKETFYIKQNPEYNIEPEKPEKRKNSIFKIKVTEPRIQNEKSLKLKF